MKDAVLTTHPADDGIEVVEPPRAVTRVLFIAGWGRSGSTLLANLLGGCAGVVNVGELRYLWSRGLAGTMCGCGRKVVDCDYWNRVLETSGWTDAGLDAVSFDDRVGARAIHRQLVALAPGRIDRYRQARSTEVEMVAQLVRRAADLGGSAVVVDSSKSVPFLVNLLQDPRFEVDVLHLTRDPRAVAHSWNRLRDTFDADGQAFPRYGPLKCVAYWTIFNLAPLIVPARCYHRLSYETFARSPRRTFEAICEIFELDMPAADWLGPSTARVDAQHTISGNPSRFRLGAVTIDEDDRWMSAMPRSARLIVGLLSAPARAVLRVASPDRRAGRA